MTSAFLNIDDFTTETNNYTIIFSIILGVSIPIIYSFIS